ncbi:hypothetical protein AB0M22_20870 [Nocardia sp. NPDC051756]|uniref:hypothetical protein n=1 Tax=Nocardia sp. NPDC051756 TaxID=3154751 RepID=UPI0034190C67
MTVRATPAKATAAAGQAEVLVRSYRATLHLWSALRAAREAKDIEARLAGTHRPSIELQAAATNAVLLSVAFMEASINEIVKDIADAEPGKPEGRCAGIDEDTAALLRALWNSRVDRFSLPGQGRLEGGAPLAPYLGDRLQPLGVDEVAQAPKRPDMPPIARFGVRRIGTSATS